MKLSKRKFNIHYRGSLWGSRTQQHACCLRCAHSQRIKSRLGEKEPQAKIPIAFLFSQLHFNNVTSDALFQGGHLVMLSKRCAVQNQRITWRNEKGTGHNKLSKRLLGPLLGTGKTWPIRHFHFSHDAPYLPPKILHNLCFSFPLGITAAPREIENNACAKLWGANN